MKVNSVNAEKNIGMTGADLKTKQGFTPGPWYVDNDGAVSASDKSRRICFTEAMYLDGGKNEAKANARLIAAAPALYEALKATACRYSRTRECVGREMCDRCAALALVNIPDPPEV